MEEQNLRDEYDDGAAGESQYRKPRLFVRELSGFTYSLAKELKKLRNVPRVIKAKDLKFKKGPQYFTCNILTPKYSQESMTVGVWY